MGTMVVVDVELPLLKEFEKEVSGLENKESANKISNIEDMSSIKILIETTKFWYVCCGKAKVLSCNYSIFDTSVARNQSIPITCVLV